MESASQVAEPLQIFRDTVVLLEKSAEAIVFEKKEEFHLKVMSTRNALIGSLIREAEEYVDPENKNRLIERLIKEAEECVNPEDKLEFGLQVTFDLDDYITELMSKALACSNGGRERIKAQWRELRDRVETSKRRRELLKPVSELEFVATLRWMIERGVEEDLGRLRQSKEDPPYTSEEIEELFEIAERRIGERVNDSDHVAKKSEGGYQQEKVVAPNMQDLGWTAFQSHLPRLLREASGKWVAFHGDRQAALGNSKQEVYERLLQMKCPLEEVVVRRIKPLGPPLNLQRFRRSRVQ